MTTTSTFADGGTLIQLSPRSANQRARVASIATALQAGDDALMERVLKELAPRVAQWTFRFLGPHPDLDDATQEALTDIASALERFQGRSSISTFAYRIAVRTASRYYRKRKSRPELSDFEVEPVSPHAGPEDQVVTRRAVAALYDHLDRLSDAQRTAFLLCGVEGLTPSEASKVVGCTSLALRLRLHRARVVLRRAIADDPRLRHRFGGRHGD